MRICLINPPWFINKTNIWSIIHGTMPPIGLLYMASYVEKKGFEVDIIDFQVDFHDWPEIEKRLFLTDYDFFGITTITSTVSNAYRIAGIIKRAHPLATVIMGGVHATALPDEALSRSSVDYVIRGEGEEPLSQLLQGNSRETIRGLSYKSNGQIVHVGANSVTEQIDLLPFPAYHKIDIRRYKPAISSYRRLPAISMITTRGCPGKCTFCNSANIKLRTRSAENILAEISMLVTKFGIREISFYDDTFTVYRNNVEHLCDLLVSHKIDVTWCCFARVDSVTESLLAKMKRAGCHQIMYGIETADERVLKNINKRINKERNENVIAMTKKAGITVRCTFMFGSPGEDMQTIDKTIDYSIHLNPDIVLYNITTPYPGTQMFTWAKDNGYLSTENWDEYDLSKPVMRLPGLSEQAIKKKYRQAFRRFYLNGKFITGRIKKLIFERDTTFFIDLWRIILRLLSRKANG